MHSLSFTNASEKLDRLLDETAARHEPVLITGPRANAVLVGEEEWNAIQETLYLLSIPGMRESIRAGLEAIALEAYREERLSTSQLRRLLGCRTRGQVHAFLKQHGVYLRSGSADLEHDRQGGDAIEAAPGSMIVVADTTPLNYLVLIDEAHLLPRLFGLAGAQRICG
jgi:antitoxin YefM